MSIKNKFATAVATASLLAGLFGSAFVPSALAAREGSASEEPAARYTEIYEGDDILTNEGGYDADGESNDASKWGFYSVDSDDVVAEDEASITVKLFHSGSSGVGSAGSEVTEIDMIVESSTSKIKVAIEDGDTCEQMDDTDTDGVGADDDLDYFAQTDTVADLADGAAGEYTFCVAANTSTTAAVGTITVKARPSDSTGSYTTVATLPFQALGELSTLEASITDGYKYIVNDNDGIDDWLTIVGKDSAGNILNGGNGTITQYETLDDLENWDDNPENWEEETIVFLDEAADESPADSDWDNDDMDYSYYSVEESVCVSNDDTESTGSEGKSYTVKFQSGDGDVVSNGITFTCTDGVAVVTKVTPEATSGDKDYDEGGLPNDDELSLNATVVDSAGRPFGDGSNVECDDFIWADIVYTSDDLSEDDFFDGGIAGGECEVTDLAPDVDRFGKFTYTLKATYPDLGDASAAASTDKSFVLTYTATGTVDSVTISRTRNAAKTVATITFDGGEGAAYESVYFQVEKANGAVVEYRRRANGDGVARLVLSRRNTVLYVYAFSETSDESDTIKVRFR